MTGPAERLGSRLALALALAALAGWTDAVGYLAFGGLFLSFMSGNTTQSGVAFGAGGWMGAIPPLIAILAFVAGAGLGTLLGLFGARWRIPAILALEALLLALAILLPAPGDRFPFAILPIAMAMGAQNTAVQRIGASQVSLTFVTGTLVRLGVSVADGLLGRESPRIAALHAAMWLALMLGAVAGAFAFAGHGYAALTVPAAALGGLAVLTAAAAAVVTGSPT